MTVRILEDALVNQIAAGEVVERPASVVKELVENALDAGATTLTISLRDGGRASIQVADDGHGMDRADALMSVERHATSKIRTQDDLIAVNTLGFRGEALPSIASVSRFVVTTRTEHDEVGTRVRLDGGRLAGVEDAGCAVGTEIDVRSLFFNVPVRRRFLRTPPTELGHCVEAVVREALVHPEVDFTVRHEGREVLRAPAVADRAARARALLGDAARALVEARGIGDGVVVQGLVSPPSVHRAAAQGGLYLYVNGRYVRDPVLRRAVREGYRGVLPAGRYPVVVVEVRVDPERVDVNVHPTKTEVRFRDPTDVARLVAGVIRAALQTMGAPAPRPNRGAAREDGPLLPLLGIAPPGPIERLPAPVEPALRAPAADHPPPPRPPVVAFEADAPPMVAEAGARAERFRTLTLLGTHGRWLVCADTELVLVDLAAAAERLAAWQLRASGEALAGQTLLTPMLVDLAPAEADAVEALQPWLDALCFELSRFGPGTLAVRTLPEALAHADVASALRELGNSPPADPDALVATLARHVGRDLDVADAWECRVVLASLDEAGAGRPGDDPTLAIRLADDELARRFRSTR